MDKLRMQSVDGVKMNVEKIRELFPSAVTEVIRDGKVEYAVDFDILKQELSSDLVEGGEERYQFTWPDKRKSILLANTPVKATLRPCVEESVDFDTTQNLYIEGDNLDVLKLLQETYLGEIKMIYIDPPYNTGNDFVYNDDFDITAEDYKGISGDYDEQGNRLTQNTTSNGRFHTDWLNMIYPRLKVARDLLTEDGVICISMADNELCNLLKVCEDIFGKKNIEVVVWKKKGGAGNTEKVIGILTEYVILCFKDKTAGVLNYREIERDYKFSDKKGKYNLEGIEKTNLGTYERKTMQFAIVDPKTNTAFYPTENMRWTIGEETAVKLIEQDKLFFDYSSMKVKRIKRKEDYSVSENVYLNLLTEEGSLAVAKDELAELLGNRELFDTPKPTKLLLTLSKMCSDKDSLVLDFFSGSATTAHAAMKLNAEDGGKRKFIMVQLPEPCDEKSEAYKAGYKNICEIGKERIRRAGKKIKEENGLTAQNLDIGFRVLKLDSSNMKEVYYKPADYRQNLLENLESNIKEDRTPLDLLFQVMLELNKPLSAKIEENTIAGKKVFIVDSNDIIACFDDSVTDEVVTAIAKRQPLYAVFRDNSLISDSVAVNFDQIFNTYSPNTKRKVL